MAPTAVVSVGRLRQLVVIWIRMMLVLSVSRGNGILKIVLQHPVVRLVVIPILAILAVLLPTPAVRLTMALLIAVVIVTLKLRQTANVHMTWPLIWPPTLPQVTCL